MNGAEEEYRLVRGDRVIVRYLDVEPSRPEFFTISDTADDPMNGYSEKLLAGTRQRFSGLSQPRQWGDEVLRIFVTGGPPNFGGGGIPHRIKTISRSAPAFLTTGAG